MVVSCWKLPSSEKPRRSPSTGMANTTSTTVPAMAAGHGFRWTRRLQRYAEVSRIGLGERRGTSRFRDGTTNPARIVTTARARPPTASGAILSPAPTSAATTKPVATTPRQRLTSMRSPANPSRAGNSVSDATTVMATTTAALTARPWMNATPITSMPRKETTTVTPAKATARPAVSMAIDVASSGGWPWWRFSR